MEAAAPGWHPDAHFAIHRAAWTLSPFLSLVQTREAAARAVPT